MAVNRSSERKRVTPLLSSSFLFWALMALNCFTKLQLPASVKVPAGAIAHVGGMLRGTSRGTNPDYELHSIPRETGGGAAFTGCNEPDPVTSRLA